MPVMFGDPAGASSLVMALIDPSDREELFVDRLITYSGLCCHDFPGGCKLRYPQLNQCATLEEKKGQQSSVGC